MANMGCEDLVLLRSHQDLADVTHHLVAGRLRLRKILSEKKSFPNKSSFSDIIGRAAYIVMLPSVSVMPRTFLEHFVSLQYVYLVFSFIIIFSTQK